MTAVKIVAARWDDASDEAREWAVSRSPKGDVDDWDTVEVQVGLHPDGVYYCRTSDDAGGGDDCPDRPYPTLADATAAAEAWASDNDETPDMGDLIVRIAEDRGWSRETAARVCREIASIPDRSGMRLDVFTGGSTSLVSVNVYRYDPDVLYESYHGAESVEDAALQLLADDAGED